MKTGIPRSASEDKDAVGHESVPTGRWPHEETEGGEHGQCQDPDTQKKAGKRQDVGTDSRLQR